MNLEELHAPDINDREFGQIGEIGGGSDKFWNPNQWVFGLQCVFRATDSEEMRIHAEMSLQKFAIHKRVAALKLKRGVAFGF